MSSQERLLNTFVGEKIAVGVSRDFLPLVNPTQELNYGKPYKGYPSQRKYEKKTNRIKTFEEYQRLFERVKECRFQIDQLDCEEEIEWFQKIMILSQDQELDQLEWYDYEWDNLWAHTFSENGHLPMIWD